MSEHTPIPWRWDGEDLWHFGVGYSDELDPHRYTGISIDRRLRSSPILEKNMEFIVNAVNSHDALVAALKDSLVWLLLATASANPKQAQNAMKQLRANIKALIDAGADSEIRMEGLEEIDKSIQAALKATGEPL